MRKIEKQIIAAIKARQNFKGANTLVECSGFSVIVKLYGHTVATFIDGNALVDFCGWNTPTTRSRINCLLDALEVPYYAHIVDGVGCVTASSHIDVYRKSLLKNPNGSYSVPKGWEQVKVEFIRANGSIPAQVSA